MENINKLTGKKISDEMLIALKKLENDETIPLEKINELPEIKEAYEKKDSGIPTHLLPGREKIKEDVLKDLLLQQSYDPTTKLFDGKIICEKRLDIVIGLPSAGKSSALVEPISYNNKSRIIDCDEAKKFIPEYKKGWGATRVHNESKNLITALQDISIKKGENIVLPIIGSKYDIIEKHINKFKSQGYNIYIHYNELSQNKALGRMIKRFFESGRFLEPNLILKYENKPKEVFEQIKNNHMVEGYSAWSNDVPFGMSPKLLETNMENPLNKNNDIEKISIDDSIIKDIKDAGFVPTKTLIKNINDYQNITNRKFTLLEAMVIYKNADVLNEQSIGKMKNIGNELKDQEIKKTQIQNQNQER